MRAVYPPTKVTYFCVSTCIDIELIRGVSRELQVGQANSIDGHLVGADRGRCLEVLRAGVGDVVILIDTVSADAETSD